MSDTDIIRQATLIRRVKVGLGRCASLYQFGPSFYVLGDRLIDFGSHQDRAIRYLQSIEADL
jgi:hypothetical protein